MKVFISWSGKRSKETAEELSSWIRQVIQAAETWISSDIQKGSRWTDQIKNELEQSKVGIICLNKDNLQSEWILFEAGALSKTLDAHVCTFLLDINPADIKPPLGQFQHTLFKKDDLRKLVHTIGNKITAIGEKTISQRELDELFDILYPRLEEKLSKIQDEKPIDGIVKRTDREILEEVLQIVRTTKQTEELYEMIYGPLLLTDDVKPLNIVKSDFIKTMDKTAKQYLTHLNKNLIFDPTVNSKIVDKNSDGDNLKEG
jgi:hypothetical protein